MNFGDKIKWRSKLLGVIFLLLVVIIMVLLNVLLPTLDVMSDNRKVRQKLVELQQFKSNLSHSAIDEKRASGADTISIELQTQQVLFEMFSNTADSLGIALQNFSVVEKQDYNAWTLITTKCTVKGNFKNIVQLVYFFELSGLESKVSAVKFYKGRENAANDKVLCDIFTRSIIKKNSDAKLTKE